MNKKTNFIYNTFLELTKKTYPYGCEQELVDSMTELGIFPKELQKDQWGNYFIKIGESRTIFASHFDTACKDSTPVNHIFEGKFIKTDGKTILGADDKAGVTIMLYLINNKIPGLYYFFIGEEVGCIGSGLASTYGDFKGKYDRIISFDRRDTNSVITYQSSQRCCSDVFADSLAKELNRFGLSYKKDDTGVYTDSAEFTDIIPECTNLSVGYYKEHTFTESQDIVHLNKLAEACLKIDWESLPTKRDTSKKEHKYNYESSYTYNNGDWNFNKSSNWRNRDYGYNDDWYDQNYSFSKKKTSYEDEYDWTDSKNWKKTKRSRKKKNSKVFYDSGGELTEMKVDKNIQYDTLIDKILDSKLSTAELEVVKEQYLDMQNENDSKFYQYLLETNSK